MSAVDCGEQHLQMPLEQQYLPPAYGSVVTPHHVRVSQLRRIMDRCRHPEYSAGPFLAKGKRQAVFTDGGLGLIREQDYQQGIPSHVLSSAELSCMDGCSAELSIQDRNHDSVVFSSGAPIVAAP
jgi:hypothetical protein